MPNNKFSKRFTYINLKVHYIQISKYESLAPFEQVKWWHCSKMRCQIVPSYWSSNWKSSVASKVLPTAPIDSCYTFCGPTGGTQLWVGYRCTARSFNYHPITKPEKMQICDLFLNHLFCEGPFLTNQYFLPCKLACMSTFWQLMGKQKEKFIENHVFCKNATYI